MKTEYIYKYKCGRCGKKETFKGFYQGADIWGEI